MIEENSVQRSPTTEKNGRGLFYTDRFAVKIATGGSSTLPWQQRRRCFHGCCVRLERNRSSADALIRRRDAAVNIEAGSVDDHRRPIYLDSALTTQWNERTMSPASAADAVDYTIGLLSLSAAANWNKCFPAPVTRPNDQRRNKHNWLFIVSLVHPVSKTASTLASYNFDKQPILITFGTIDNVFRSFETWA